MNVLHINQSDISGGAAIAAYRLHQGLLAHRVDSQLLVGAKHTHDPRIAKMPRRPFFEKQIARITWRLGLNFLHLTGTFDVPRLACYQQADVLHFHNLHREYFNYLALPTLTRRKPAIFTLHDMWSFTGHCAYSYGCERWKIGCGNCPSLDIYPSIQRDFTQWEWKLKAWVYAHSDVTIVTLSRWLTKQAKQSMLHRFPIHEIPNGIDTDTYRPYDVGQCRDRLHIPRNKKVLIFVVVDLKEYRKGGDLLLRSLQYLPESLKSETCLLTIGEKGEYFAQESRIPALNLGYLQDDRLKAMAYSAADLCVFPSRADNLPQVLQESMACGTPLISFDVGGIPDLVRHGVTGYLARPEDAKDFSQGISQLLEDEHLRKEMGQHCRTIALQEYRVELQVERYRALYQQKIRNSSPEK